MFIVNTSLKKFTESASLDLGLLPADGKIDIQLTDGSRPVIAEGKQFTMTVGTIEGTLYKTDWDTVSFRYLQFDDDNVSATLPIVISMDGVEILNDTISLTYQEVGGGDSGNPDYLAISLSNDNSTITLAKVGTPSEIAIEYSLDKTTWTALVPDTAITIPTAWTKCYFRGNNTGFSSNSNYYNFVFGGGQAYIYGNVMSLLDTSCTSVTIPTACCFTSLFEYISGVKVQSFQLALPAIYITEGCYKYMFKNQTDMTGKFPALPATVLQKDCYEGMFSGCNSMTGKVILPAVSPVKDCYKEMLRYCNNLQYIDCNFSPDYYGTYYTNNWLQNTGQSASTPRYFYMPYGTYSPNTDNSRIPDRWTRLYKDTPCDCIKAVTTSTDSSYTVTPFVAKMASITVSSALTLSATAIDSGSVAYAEVVLDIASGATVTAGTGLTLVDTPTEGKRNICVVRWSGGVAKLYVTIVEDLPQG